MTIQELNEYLRINSLQFFVGDDIEVTDEILTGLARRSLTKYGQYRPIPKHTYEQIQGRSHFIKTIEDRKVVNIQSISYVDKMIDPKSDVDFPWTFSVDSGELRIPIAGSFYIESLVAPKLEDIDFDCIEFLDMTQGLFMMYIGQSRKGFSLSELPFENDGADVYADGKELYESTIEKLSEVNSNWYLAIN